MCVCVGMWVCAEEERERERERDRERVRDRARAPIVIYAVKALQKSSGPTLSFKPCASLARRCRKLQPERLDLGLRLQALAGIFQKPGFKV